MSEQTAAWLPILPEFQANTAKMIAGEVAERCSDLEILERAARTAPEQSDFPIGVQWVPASVAGGSAGIAIVFGYLDSCFPEQGWDIVARQHVEFAVRAVESGNFNSPALFAGLGGVAFAAWYLSQSGSRYRELSAKLHEALFPSVASLTEQVATATGGVSYHNYDVISGLSGTGAYLLCRRDFSAARDLLSRVLRSLTTLAADDGGLPRWYTPVGRMPDEKMASMYPGGVLNCGLSHGIPGQGLRITMAKLGHMESLIS